MRKRLSAFAPASARLILQTHAIYFLTLLRRECFEQRRRQTRVTLFNFLVAQRAFVRAIFESQRHGSFRRLNVSTFESANKLNAAAISHMLIVHRVEDLFQRDV